MKVFSLETKRQLVGWSLVLGLVFNIIAMIFTQETGSPGIDYSKLSPQQIAVIEQPIYNAVAGLPYKYGFGGFRGFGAESFFIFLIDWLFWILVALIVLSLIRHFRRKSNMPGAN